VLERAHKDASDRREDLALRVRPGHVDDVKRKVVFGHYLPPVAIGRCQVTEDVEDEAARRALLLLAKGDEVLVRGKGECLRDHWRPLN
jgi:hypothetical protein